MKDIYNQMVDQFESGNYNMVVNSAIQLLRAGSQENHLDIFMIKGAAEEELERLEDALSTYTKAVELFPDAFDPRYRKAMVSMDLLKFVEANSELKLLNERFPNNLELLNNFLFSEESLFNHDKVIQICDQILSCSEPEVSVLSIKAKAYGFLGNYDEAMRWYNTALQLNDLDDLDLAFLYQDMGYTYSQKLDFKKAKEYFEKALSYDDDSSHYYHLAWVEANLGNIDKGMSLVNQAIEMDPKGSYAYKVRAKVLLLQHNTEDAIVELQKSKLLDYAIEHGEEVNELLKKYGAE